jgi:hypothetical protein
LRASKIHRLSVAATYPGVLISTDGGITFAAGASQGVQNNQALAISPGTPSNLYLVNSSGVQLSTDGGQTFSVIYSPSAQFTPFARIAVDPRNPATVYVADYSILLRSTDGGHTWTQVTLPYNITPQTILISAADSRLFLGPFTQNNAFVTKWSADGSQILYSTYLGGSGNDGGRGIATDAGGNAYITGSATSANFPTTSGAYQTKLTSMQERICRETQSGWLPTALFHAARKPGGIACEYCGGQCGRGSNHRSRAMRS